MFVDLFDRIKKFFKKCWRKNQPDEYEEMFGVGAPMINVWKGETDE